jgi:hypothetical protein
MTIQDIVKSIEDQEELFEVIRQRRIEQKEAEILADREELKQAISAGTAKRGNVHYLIADLLEDSNASCLG